MKTKRTLTVAECAEFIEKSQPYVREGLKRGRLPFGTAVQVKGEGNWDYNIPTVRVERYMGESYDKWLKNKKYIGEQKCQ